ncbi:MAG TPA: chemotaxis protein CheW [Spirochaetia bacterium]
MTPERIDWDEIRRRMEATRDALVRGADATPAEKERILRERARVLAMEEKAPARTVPTIQVLVFLLGQERYAVESRYVREVYPLNELTPLPGIPPFVLGIANVRGSVLAVVDVGRLFELPQKGIGELDRIIVLENGVMEFGVLANSILDVTEIVVEDLQPPLPTLSGVRERYLRGIARDRTAVLDAPRLLTDKDLVVREEA